MSLPFESGTGYPAVHINKFLAYRNSAGYPTLRTQVKYEPRDMPRFGVKGLMEQEHTQCKWTKGHFFLMCRVTCLMQHWISVFPFQCKADNTTP